MAKKSLLQMVKEMQAVLMVNKELPHLVGVRLLARLDEAEKHLPVGKVKSTTVLDRSGGRSSQSPEGKVLELPEGRY